ncbi:hypothetical protein RB595_004965 [Gaeumannomyces hyphopodioides]
MLTFGASVSILAGIALVLLVARFHLRLKIQQKWPEIADYFLVIGWLCAIVTSASDVILLAWGWPAETLQSFANYTGDPYQLDSFLKWWYWNSYPYYLGFYLCKFALLGLYLQLFPRHLKRTRYVLYGTVAFNFSSFIASILLLTLPCLPYDRNWSLDPNYMCDNGITVFEALWALHFVSDMLIFLLPFLILHGIKMKKPVKVGVYITFGLGIIDLAVCLVLRFILVRLTLDTMTQASLAFYSVLDLYVCLIIACLPPLRPYLHILRPGGSTVGGSSSAKLSSARDTHGSWPGQRAKKCGQNHTEQLSPIPAAASTSRLGSTDAVFAGGDGTEYEYELAALPGRRGEGCDKDEGGKGGRPRLVHKGTAGWLGGHVVVESEVDVTASSVALPRGLP